MKVAIFAKSVSVAPFDDSEHIIIATVTDDQSDYTDVQIFLTNAVREQFIQALNNPKVEVEES